MDKKRDVMKLLTETNKDRIEEEMARPRIETYIDDWGAWVAYHRAKDKGEEFKNVLKTGRTHLQDAMPVTLGGEFHAYGQALERIAMSMDNRNRYLLDLPLGGTATGTGINTHPDYRRKVVDELSRIWELDLKPNPSPYEAMQSTTRIVGISSSYKELAVEGLERGGMVEDPPRPRQQSLAERVGVAPRFGALKGLVMSAASLPRLCGFCSPKTCVLTWGYSSPGSGSGCDMMRSVLPW